MLRTDFTALNFEARVVEDSVDVGFAALDVNRQLFGFTFDFYGTAAYRGGNVFVLAVDVERTTAEIQVDCQLFGEVLRQADGHLGSAFVLRFDVHDRCRSALLHLDGACAFAVVLVLSVAGVKPSGDLRFRRHVPVTDLRGIHDGHLGEVRVDFEPVNAFGNRTVLCSVLVAGRGHHRHRKHAERHDQGEHRRDDDRDLPPDAR